MKKTARVFAITVLALSEIAIPCFGQAAPSGSVAHRSLSSAASTAELGRVATRRGSRATRLYDGGWSVVIQTTNGNCPAGIRASLRIIGGRLMADDQSYHLGGSVAPGGAVRVSVSAGGQGAGGYGRLSRNGGRGVWRTWSGECSGQWIAERRD